MQFERAGGLGHSRKPQCQKGWAWVQVQAGGVWREPAGVDGQLISCSFTTQASVRMARLPPHDVFNLVFINEHKPWQQIPACSACAGGVCPLGRLVALDQSKGLEARETQLLWD